MFYLPFYFGNTSEIFGNVVQLTYSALTGMEPEYDPPNMGKFVHKCC